MNWRDGESNPNILHIPLLFFSVSIDMPL